MSCQGFVDNGFMGDCSMAWLGIAFLFFIVIFLRKGMEVAGYDFNFLFGLIGAYLPYIIVVTLTGSAKWSLLSGIIGVFVGGVILAQFYGGDSD
jgi:hypothetical protein